MPDTVGSAIYDILMSTTTINQLLSCTSTKHRFSYYLAHVFLENFEEKSVNAVVVCDTDYQPMGADQGLSMQWWCVTQTINPWGPTKGCQCSGGV